MQNTSKNILTRRLTEKWGQPLQIQRTSSVSGGSINDAYRIETNKGDFFVKINQNCPSDFFEKEAHGLETLRKSGSIKVPEVLDCFAEGQMRFLVINFIPAEMPKADFWADFGEKLAKLHQNTQDQFGLEVDNYMGAWPQKNERLDKWADFFISCRLIPLVKAAYDRKMMDKKLLGQFERFYAKVAEIFPDEKPALIHGDLWSGNFIHTKEVMLIDPAVAYSHREADLAMTKLFGGFDAALYEAYQRTYPTEKGVEQRYDFYNIYPLLIHVLLFGEGYLSGIKNTLSKF